MYAYHVHAVSLEVWSPRIGVLGSYELSCGCLQSDLGLINALNHRAISLGLQIYIFNSLVFHIKKSNIHGENFKAYNKTMSTKQKEW